MNNDLISRKALMEEIESLYIGITGLRAGKGVLLKFAEEYKKSILKCIEQAPTAYDSDAVCKNLDKASDYYETDEQGKEHVQMVNLTDAIEIVRNGGKKK